MNPIERDVRYALVDEAVADVPRAQAANIWSNQTGSVAKL
jgi:hypothetical protein